MKCLSKFSRTCGFLALLAGLVVFGGGLPSVARAADEKADEAVPVMTESAQAVVNIGLAHDLIQYGRKTKTPEALITAALILHRTPAEAAKEPLQGELPPAIDLAALLAEAQKLRPNDKALADLVAQAQDGLKEKSRGATTGPKQVGGTLAAGANAATGAVFKAREPAVIRVAATPLPGKPFTAPAAPSVRLVVTNAQNQVVGQGVGAAPQVHYVPAAAGPLKITVTNVGHGPVHFTIIHN